MYICIYTYIYRSLPVCRGGWGRESRACPLRRQPRADQVEVAILYLVAGTLVHCDHHNGQAGEECIDIVCVCLYIHIYVYVCLYVYIYIYVYIYVFAGPLVHCHHHHGQAGTYLYSNIWLSIYTYICIYMYICLYVCMYTYIYIYVVAGPLVHCDHHHGQAGKDERT